MATKSGPPIGPFPDGIETDEQKEEYDKLRRRVLWKMPYGLYVVGSPGRGAAQRHDPQLGDAGELRAEAGRDRRGEGGLHPRADHRRRGLLLNVLSREDRAIVRKFVKPVEVDPDGKTLNGFPFHDGQTGAPILDQAVAYVDCEVRNPVDCGGHTFFIGEVIDSRFQVDDEETEVLRMEDTRMSYGG